jgi:hypothetical protein
MGESCPNKFVTQAFSACFEISGDARGAEEFVVPQQK